MSGAVERKIISVQGTDYRTEVRELVEEVGFEIQDGSKTLGRLSCSPWNIRQAAIGWLFMNGDIRQFGNIRSLDICEECGLILFTPQGSLSLPSPAATQDMTLSTAEVIRLSAMLEERSLLFRRTGGVHSAALCVNGELVAYEEDVSRHAAVDKVVGVCLEKNISMEDGVLLFSGRIPGEIVRKLQIMGCRMIIARSAPTELACRLAEDSGITVIGFARDDTFNVYTCPHRISDITLQ